MLHELRTPLAVIRSAGQNLAAGVVQDPKRYGELIETEGRRLTDMVEQTLALAGLSGERRMAQTPIDADEVARAVIASPETSTRADGIDFDVRIAEELPLVLADEMLLRRGVQNLFGNALKDGASGRDRQRSRALRGACTSQWRRRSPDPRSSVAAQCAFHVRKRHRDPTASPLLPPPRRW